MASFPVHLFLIACHLIGIFASPIHTGDPLPFNTSSTLPVLEERDHGNWKPDYFLHLTAEKITLACREDQHVLVNGQHPGPLLRFKEEEPKWVRVYNHLHPSDEIKVVGVAMHWHGLDIENHHDGTPETQFLIPPGFYRDYKIHLPRGSSGSYLYHDHAMSLSAGTATGPIIVDPADDAHVPYSYDDERIIFLSDVFPRSDAEIEKGLVGSNFIWSSEPRNILVNGKGYSFFSPSEIDEDELNPPVEHDTCQIEIIRITAGQSYRFRFISGSASTHSTFAIWYTKLFASHAPWMVIEADGGYTKPFPTDRVHIGSGQRYSVLFPAIDVESFRRAVKGGSPPGFWLEGRESTRFGHSRGPSLIWVQVDDPADQEKPAPFMPLEGKKRDLDGNRGPLGCDGWYKSDFDINFEEEVEADLPLQSLTDYSHKLLSKPSATIRITAEDIVFQREDGEENRWALNGHSYFGPPNGVPRLLAMSHPYPNSYCPNPHAYESPERFDRGTELYTLKKGDVVDIILQNKGTSSTPQEEKKFAEGYDPDGEHVVSDAHPFHFHGAHYFDLGAGRGEYDPEQVTRNIRENKVLKRDTSMLWQYAWDTELDKNVNWHQSYIHGWRAIRMEVERPGLWLFHCHALQHMLMGMTSAWAFGTVEDIQNLPSPELNGWDQEGPRNVFSVHDTFARPNTQVFSHEGLCFSEILPHIQGEKLGEPLSQGAFGVKASY